MEISEGHAHFLFRLSVSGLFERVRARRRIQRTAVSPQVSQGMYPALASQGINVKSI